MKREIIKEAAFDLYDLAYQGYERDVYEENVEHFLEFVGANEVDYIFTLEKQVKDYKKALDICQDEYKDLLEKNKKASKILDDLYFQISVLGLNDKL